MMIRPYNITGSGARMGAGVSDGARVRGGAGE